MQFYPEEVTDCLSVTLSLSEYLNDCRRAHSDGILGWKYSQPFFCFELPPISIDSLTRVAVDKDCASFLTP